MEKFKLGINNCFAVKRWPEPNDWASIVRDELDIDLVQHSLDLVDLDVSPDLVEKQSDKVRIACDNKDIVLHSTCTGLAAYSENLLLHPSSAMRKRAEDWFKKVIAFSAQTGAISTGGHVGAFSVNDWNDTERKELLTNELHNSLKRLAKFSRLQGLEDFFIEPMAVAREPSTMSEIQELIRDGDSDHVPLRICLDVGHQCVPGTSGEERDPYAWLERFGSHASVIHLQQSDGVSDHHWPFTSDKNKIGYITPSKIIASLEKSGVTSIALILEIIHPFEEEDGIVLSDLKNSVDYWKNALRQVESQLISSCTGL
jgi:sugar phosphate isomerase/epimerase